MSADYEGGNGTHFLSSERELYNIHVHLEEVVALLKEILVVLKKKP